MARDDRTNSHQHQLEDGRYRHDMLEIGKYMHYDTSMLYVVLFYAQLVCILCFCFAHPLNINSKITIFH